MRTRGGLFVCDWSGFVAGGIENNANLDKADGQKIIHMVLCRLHRANPEFILSFDEIIMAAKFYEIENYQTQKIKILNINIRWDRPGA